MERGNWDFHNQEALEPEVIDYDATNSDTPSEQDPEEAERNNVHRLDQGDRFWHEALGISGDTDIELTAGQKILGSFFRIPTASDRYTTQREKHKNRPTRITAFGLEASDNPWGSSEEVRFFPFNDDIREQMHPRLASVLEKNAQKTNDAGRFWSDIANHWLTPLSQAIYEHNYSTLKSAEEKRIREYWQEQIKDFSGNSTNFKNNNSQKQKFHTHLIENHILSEEEIKLIENFDEVQESATDSIIETMVKPLKSFSSTRSPEMIVRRDVEKQTKRLFRCRQRDIMKNYRETSDFKYRNAVDRKIRSDWKTEPEALDYFIDRCLGKLDVNNEATRNNLIEEFNKLQEATEKTINLKIKYTEALTLWGTPPKEITDKCRDFRNRTLEKLEARQNEEKAKARREVIEIESTLATNLGASLSQDNLNTQTITLPTGIIVLSPDLSVANTIPASPLEEKILKVLPNQYLEPWLQTWQSYEQHTKQNVTGHAIGDEVASIVGKLVDEYLSTLPDYDKLPEAQLKQLQRNYHFITNRIINTKNGNLNPQFSSAEVSALAQVMPYFGDFISAVKKPAKRSNKTLNSVQNEIKQYLAGERKNERGIDNPPESLIRNGVLNINDLHQLVNQDDPGAELTINLMANCIGISLYGRLKGDERKTFEDMIGDRANVSRKSFFQAFDVMIYDSARREGLMKRILFVSYFGQYLTGNAPKEFNDLINSIIGKTK